MHLRGQARRGSATFNDTDGVQAAADGPCARVVNHEGAIGILMGIAVDHGRLCVDQTLGELLPRHASSTTATGLLSIAPAVSHRKGRVRRQRDSSLRSSRRG